MKTIVICCDGTWNTADQQQQGQWAPSNVTLMSQAIRSNAQQLIYYDAGLGTNGWLDKFTGGVFGLGLFQNIKQAYCYIVEHYQPGDKLVFLGFSRGAYTVRSLAGLITRVGILKADYLSEHKTAFNYYRKTGLDQAVIDNFSQKFCQPSKQVFFVGVWDTIGSLGIPLSSFNWLTHWYYKFHNTQLSPQVKHGYHALAIDEKRRSFKPVLWNISKRDNSKWNKSQFAGSKSSSQLSAQTVEQCWFAGVHSNIGGGYQLTGLSDISFNWIQNKLQSALPDLKFNTDFIALKIKPDYKAEIADSLSWFFPVSKLLPIQRKPLQYNAINEIIAPSVIKRKNCIDCQYHPENLM